jgi:hypothetical protein
MNGFGTMTSFNPSLKSFRSGLDIRNVISWTLRSSLYNGLRPSMILSSIKMIAMTSNMWIKPPTEPYNPNSHRINRITTNVVIKSIKSNLLIDAILTECLYSFRLFLALSFSSYLN